jgi:FkbM family methyltransferase
MNTRILSIINSIRSNGFNKTIILLNKIFLLKIGRSSCLTLKKYGKFHLRKNTSDLPVFRQVFLDLEYEFLKGSKDSKIIIDAGANIGMFTKFLNPIFPNSKFICIEPEPSNFDVLKRNIGNNNNVSLLQKALWNDDKGVTININPKYGEWGATTSNTKETGTKIESITMEQLLNKFDIKEVDILKIDIEGAENSLFQGDLNWMKKTKTIIIELHDFMDNGSSNNFFKSLETIKPYNFSVVGENIIINRINQ